MIEPSVSPWRAQIVIAKNEQNPNKRRLCIDYSTTVNIYTELDSYPLPKLDKMINDLANYKYFSTFDLKSAYHQIPIKDEEKPLTAFEANGKIYQFNRIPFGVTNGVATFQLIMDQIIEEEDLKNVFPYLDNITVAGNTQEDHDESVKKFLEAVKRRNLKINENKTIKSVKSINLLGYLLSIKAYDQTLKD